MNSSFFGGRSNNKKRGLRLIAQLAGVTKSTPISFFFAQLPLPSFGGTSGGGIVGTDRPVNLSKTPDADYPPTQLLPPPTLTELPTQIQTAAQSQSGKNKFNIRLIHS